MGTLRYCRRAEDGECSGLKLGQTRGNSALIHEKMARGNEIQNFPAKRKRDTESRIAIAKTKRRVPSLRVSMR
jgi:hypothetical protein